ncbi:hypothetical protein [Sphingomonas sp. 1P08PE]|uniref:hypothetical protein n=1 Tax=Sphingomonas sp. 1P08PE TaxID=554122 RepID=UPI0039A2BE49
MKAVVKSLLGIRVPPAGEVGLDALTRDWTFAPSPPNAVVAALRVAMLARVRRAPASLTLTPLNARPRWIVYFVYLPAGELTAAHRFTLDRLRSADASLCVICAAPSPRAVPEELRRIADALYWKDLPGFDFSAYALAVRETARLSPGADMLILNDSTFGPFASLDELWPAMRWELTGFTAFSQMQDHIQSYAFHLRQVTSATVQTLRTVLPSDFAVDHYRSAVYLQESRFAAVAARSMSVGALWHADARRCGDPSIFAALPLVRAGFPFLKRSLLSKNAHAYPRQALLDTLRDLGHPVDTL